MSAPKVACFRRSWFVYTDSALMLYMHVSAVLLSMLNHSVHPPVASQRVEPLPSLLHFPAGPHSTLIHAVSRRFGDVSTSCKKKTKKNATSLEAPQNAGKIYFFFFPRPGTGGTFIFISFHVYVSCVSLYVERFLFSHVAYDNVLSLKPTYSF